MPSKLERWLSVSIKGESNRLAKPTRGCWCAENRNDQKAIRDSKVVSSKVVLKSKVLIGARQRNRDDSSATNLWKSSQINQLLLGRFRSLFGTPLAF